MKAESNISPVAPFEIEFNGNSADVIFFENVTEATDENGEKKFVYDTYRITVPARSNLAETIENNFEAWLAAAKSTEYNRLAAAIREKRDKLLAESDKALCIDRLGLEAPSGSTFAAWSTFLKALGDVLCGKWARYRQALRDIPQQENFPYNVTFPTKPEED